MASTVHLRFPFYIFSDFSDHFLYPPPPSFRTCPCPFFVSGKSLKNKKAHPIDTVIRACTPECVVTARRRDRNKSTAQSAWSIAFTSARKAQAPKDKSPFLLRIGFRFNHASYDPTTRFAPLYQKRNGITIRNDDCGMRIAEWEKLIRR